MDCIRKNIISRGLEIHLSVPAATNWAVDPHITRKLAQSDMIVVNGEGTLHHGRPKGQWLLDIADHPDLAGIPKALINALWQANPDHWLRKLSGFDLVATRDSKSAEEIHVATGIEVFRHPDLSVCTPIASKNFLRRGILVGDSVSGGAAASLAQLAVQLSRVSQSVSHTPLITNEASKVQPTKLTGRLRKSLSKLRFLVSTSGNLDIRFAKSLEEYLDLLMQCELSISGRFHSICLCIATRTPFIAVPSNSRKIEALLIDVGLSPDRIATRQNLSTSLVTGRDWSFSPDELSGIEAFLATGQEQAEKLFDHLREIALVKKTSR
jgi:Polysaccharide pyruvyl transferase